MKKIVITLCLVFSIFSVFAQETKQDWRQELKEQLPLLGHRNWILVVDAAYPLQSKPAIKTIATGESQLTVVKEVLAAIEEAPHVYPEVFLDKEIDFVPEADAKGIEAYKEELNSLLYGKHVTKELHEQLIANIDEAAKVFNILVLKTDLTLPYTSVFFRLECGYWDAGKEKMMRELINKK